MLLGVKAMALGVALVLVGVLAPTAGAGARRGDEVLDDALGTALDESGAQSISAAVVYADGRVWTGAKGLADATAKRRATPSTPYAVASITKMFVASVAMQLVDEGVLALDEPVARWLPELRDAERVTLRQLLGHTSGFSETLPQGAPADRSTPAEALAQAGAPACEPGGCVAEVDTNYVAVGQVIAAATGRPIEAVLRSRILEPLGLERTWLQGFERSRGKVAPARLGPAVFADPEGNTPSTEFVTRIGAAGALAATARDLAAFGDALFRGRVVDDAALVAMTDVEASAALPCPDVERCPGAYGLGVAFEVIHGVASWGHSGSTGSLVAYFPEYRLTIAVVTNGGADPYPAAAAIADAIPSMPNRLDLFRIDADGTGAARIGRGRGQRSGPAVSPDGAQVAYTRARHPGDADLAVADLDGGHERVIVGGPANDGHPTWSPDGAQLAYSSVRDGDGEISVVDADGSNRRRLTDDTGFSGGPAWSPDGALIAYHYFDRTGVEIRVVRPDGTGQRTVVRAPIRGRFMGDPSWSPDGTRLAFTGADGGDTDIQIVGLDGSNLTTLTTDHLPESEVAWSRDGRIAFARLGDISVVMPGDPTTLEQVTRTATEEFALAWSPDGQTIVFTDRVPLVDR